MLYLYIMGVIVVIFLGTIDERVAPEVHGSQPPVFSPKLSEG